jgi:hypothetical protein
MGHWALGMGLRRALGIGDSLYFLLLFFSLQIGKGVTHLLENGYVGKFDVVILILSYQCYYRLKIIGNQTNN